ncbi:MAG: hypothetical protein QMD11_09140 [Smithella sp.]|nr:hypothetical protein [Smithella sp.]
MIVQIVLVILIIMFLSAGLKVASEHQRLVLFRLGRYLGLRGPGLIVIIPGADKCFTLSIGDQGQLISDGIGKFKNSEVPVEYNEKIYAGEKIKINGFLNQKIQVILDSDQRRVVKCEKCGHEIKY